MKQDILSAAGFITIGLTAAGVNETLAHWHDGYLEYIIEGTSYAPFLTALGYAAAKVSDGYPGVFDYEVSEDFGVWFSCQVRTNSRTPSEPECRVKLVKSVLEFFTQTKANNSAVIESTLMDVKLFRGEQS